MIVVVGKRRGPARVDWEEGGGGGGGDRCEVREAGRPGARSAGADTGISFRLGAFPFYKVKMVLKL